MYTVFALWYSAKQFEEKGWSAPVTWDDVMTIGENAAGEGLSLFAFGGQNAADYYHTMAIAMAVKQGGKEVATALDSLDAGAYEQDAVVQAIDAIGEAVAADFFLPGGAGIKHTEAQAQWVTGKAVMYPSGSWIENEQKGVTPDDFAMTGCPEPLLSADGAMPAEAIHGTAGEPFQYCPFFTLPTTPEPGATSAFLPTVAPGNSVVRAPMVASVPMLIGPTWKMSPSIQCPVRSTSGSTDARCPMVSMPVTGGAECRSTPLPIELPRARP